MDDGKSTLIGRLLHDSEVLPHDQVEAVRRASRGKAAGDDPSGSVDLSFFVDGLRAEREQGITIDVAYRFFATSKRKYIIADTPGHEQYTRNMATGASTSNLAVLLVDATRGVRDQTRRHAFIVSLLGIRHLVLAVNKMDMVGWSRERFEEICEEFTSFAAKLEIEDIEFIPMSATLGDNVVHESTNMPWYRGRALLDHLDSVHIASDVNLIDLRFPIQYVIRDRDARLYAGSLASGVMRKGDELVELTSLRRAVVAEIATFDGPREEVFAPMAVTVRLDRDIDAARGSIFAPVLNVPHVASTVEVMLVWMSETPMSSGREYLLKHCSTTVSATPALLRYKINMSDLRRESAAELHLNDIGRVQLHLNTSIAFDAYSRNRQTGALILIDRISNETVAAGMIMERSSAEPDESITSGRVTSAERAARNHHDGAIVWLTGAKTHDAEAIERMLFERDHQTFLLDRSSLGYDVVDETSARSVAAAARLLASAGLIAVVVDEAGFGAPAGEEGIIEARLEQPGERENVLATLLGRR